MLESILYAIAGGALIGLAASAMLYLVGRIAGISGIVGGLLPPSLGDIAWRVAFVAGLFAGGLVLVQALPGAIATPHGRSLPMLVAAGLIVGFGTRMGNGCTSGHGVCGISRMSRRSLVATAAFMIGGFITASLISVLGASA